MSKGCFIRFIIILTIFIAVVLYIFQTKFEDWILKPGKGLMKEELNDTWGKEMAFVQPSVQKDSLKELIENYIEDLKSEDLLDNKMDSIKIVVKNAIADSALDWKELENLKNFLRVKE